MEAVTEPQGTQVCLPPPGFESPLLEQDIPLIRNPNPDGAQSALMPVSAMSMAVYKNKVMGISSMSIRLIIAGHCNPESPSHRPKITKL